jgi:23S rRNA G2445 N2-methylase RlmL
MSSIPACTHHAQVEASVEAASSLHLRGCKPYSSDTQLRETIAAACVSEALVGADTSAPLKLWDPFCGSGTMLLESALLLARRATGSALLPARRPAAEELHFVKLASHDEEGYAAFLDQAVARATALAAREPPALQLFGSDLSARAVEASRHNVQHGLGALASGVSILDPQDFEKAAALVPADALILTNIPWNVRAPAETYARVGKVFSERAEAGAPVLVVSGNTHFVAQSRCTWKTLLRFRVGGAPAHLLRLVPK